MRQLLDIARRLVHDERGVFLPLFGILAIVLIATSGAVVDYTTVEQARSRAQVALDAAALALQPRIYTDSNDVLKGKAQALLVERLGDPSITANVLTATKDTTEGSLRFTAQLTVPMAFVSLVGIKTMSAGLLSEATRKMLNLEVVMVLDNSNSMSSYSRMTHLRSAANCLANILYNDNCSSTATTASNDRTWIGIVPFTMQVNVGTGNANASWMDRTGGNGSRAARSGHPNNITNDNFDSDDNDTTLFSGTIDRIALMNQMTNVNWGGCVEARISPHDTTDALPVAGTNTMFTPLFAPDEPDSGFSNSYLSDRPASCTNKDAGTWTETRTKTDCSSTWSSGASDSSKLSTYNNCSSNGSTSRSSTKWDGSNQTAATTQPATMPDKNGKQLASNCSTNFSSTRTRTNPSRYTLVVTTDCSYNFNDRVLQERICKYTGATASGISQASAKGPNADCPTNPIVPLTTTKATVKAGITALAPQGGTNIHAGAIWGFHVLSPSEPFTQGAAYTTATSKVMIIMTDGENTAYQTGNMNNTTYYSYYGFPWNERLGNSGSSNTQLETTMNSRLATTCTNAKAAGIRIYTVGLSVNQTSNPTTNTDLLKNCSSGDGFWFFPTDPSQLTTVFEDIANQLSQLRLAL